MSPILLIFFIIENKNIINLLSNNIYKLRKDLSVRINEIINFKTVFIIIILYFFSTSGVLYTVFDEDKSMILSNDGNQVNDLIIHEEEKVCCKWINQKTSYNTSIFHTDYYGRFRLVMHSNLTPKMNTVINKNFNLSKEYPNQFTYLRYSNIYNNEIIINPNLRVPSYNLNNISKIIIYDNGGSIILLN